MLQGIMKPAMQVEHLRIITAQFFFKNCLNERFADLRRNQSYDIGSCSQNYMKRPKEKQNTNFIKIPQQTNERDAEVGELMIMLSGMNVTDGRALRSR